jgi:non-ribosomal peptide synthetase component E (peptide arylation enzyme)
MDPIQKRELKRQAFQRLAAQRRRAGMLRGRVVAISLICFVVLWGIVFAQMATGNDPVLSAKQASSTTRTVASAKGEVETTDPRELETEREAARARAREEEAVETEAEPVETEPEAEEEVVEAEPVEEEVVEAEPVEEEVVEESEPLVTSQS